MKKYIEFVVTLSIGLGFMFLAVLITSFIQGKNTVVVEKVIYTDDYKKVYNEGFFDGGSHAACLRHGKGAAYIRSNPPRFTWDDCITPEEAAESGFSYTQGRMPMP